MFDHLRVVVKHLLRVSPSSIRSCGSSRRSCCSRRVRAPGGRARVRRPTVWTGDRGAGRAEPRWTPSCRPAGRCGTSCIPGIVVGQEAAFGADREMGAVVAAEAAGARLVAEVVGVVGRDLIHDRVRDKRVDLLELVDRAVDFPPAAFQDERVFRRIHLADAFDRPVRFPDRPVALTETRNPFAHDVGEGLADLAFRDRAVDRFGGGWGIRGRRGCGTRCRSSSSTSRSASGG